MHNLTPEQLKRAHRMDVFIGKFSAVVGVLAMAALALGWI